MKISDELSNKFANMAFLCAIMVVFIHILFTEEFILALGCVVSSSRYATFIGYSLYALLVVVATIVFSDLLSKIVIMRKILFGGR